MTCIALKPEIFTNTPTSELDELPRSDSITDKYYLGTVLLHKINQTRSVPVILSRLHATKLGFKFFVIVVKSNVFRTYFNELYGLCDIILVIAMTMLFH